MQREDVGSPRRSVPSPSASPPPVAEGITVSPTLLKELSGGQKVEYIDFVKVGPQHITAFCSFHSAFRLAKRKCHLRRCSVMQISL